jgi:SAM-dependent methyltransferase
MGPFDKSILKREKFAAIAALLPPLEGTRCLDLGGDNGVISAMLRRRGGEWHSADLGEEAVGAIRRLVGERVFRIDGAPLPFPPGALDTVVIVDLLEHVRDDRALIAGIHRALRTGGTLIANVPLHRERSLIRRIRNRLGLTDERHGHVRPGYTPEGLRALLAGFFTVTDERRYSGFCTELLDAGINAALKGGGHGAKGLVVTEADLERNRGKYRLYAALYPFMLAFSLLDRVLPFGGKHKLIVKAVRV